jgi:hypothetical protein
LGLLTLANGVLLMLVVLLLLVPCFAPAFGSVAAGIEHASFAGPAVL